ncbi:MAG: hypothetical protein ABSC19_14800, partial [Syntrophorhabdales bacterium]
DGAGSGQSARRKAMFPALETKVVFPGEKEGRRFQMRLPWDNTASPLTKKWKCPIVENHEYYGTFFRLLLLFLV